MFRIDDRCEVRNAGNVMKGKIVAGPVLIGFELSWPVLLDEGFFSEDRKTYVRILLAAGSNVHKAD